MGACGLRALRARENAAILLRTSSKELDEPAVLSLERRSFNGLIPNVDAVEDLISDD